MSERPTAIERLASEPVEVPAGLVERTMRRLGPALAARRRHRRRIVLGLALVAALSLPLVLAANAAQALLLHSVLERYLPEAAAAAATSIVGASMLLALSLAYGSLPILASWGLQLQEQTS